MPLLRPAWLTLLAVLFGFTGSPVASATPITPASKIAADLQQAVSAPTTPTLSWVKDSGAVRYVKALVISNSSDPELTALRAEVLARGGSVYMRYVSVSALSVLLPAHQVGALALRSDVQSISPNRLTARTGVSMTPSIIEQASGVAAVRTRTESNSVYYTGLDGKGVGIAVLDSGVMWKHQLFADYLGQTRVKRPIDFLKVGDATAVGVKDWTPGVDVPATLAPGSAAQASYESSLNNTDATYVDAYGHGTHVAAVAAGRDFKQTLDTTGIAPGANLYDVKVLDGKGFGQLSDVLAGIDWVIFHARQYNIRVMNLSLAADSTESHLTDPLARAARSAVAAGITVVVAAGNFGQGADGRERYGTVSSPVMSRRSSRSAHRI